MEFIREYSKELADVITRPLNDFLMDLGIQIGPIGWKLADVPVFQKSKKDEPGNSRPGSLTSVTGKIMENTILGGIEKHLKDNAVISHSQHRFMMGKSCLSELTLFYDRVMPKLDQGKPVDAILLDFSEGFNTASHRILLEKMSSTQLGKYNWLMGCTKGCSEWGAIRLLICLVKFHRAPPQAPCS